MVLLPPHVVHIIKRVQRKQAEYKKQRGTKWRRPEDQWLIAHLNGKPVQPGTMNTWWNASLKHAGVPHRRLHASRHTAATAMILGGVPAAKVAAWLGHSDGGVLALRTYGHVQPDDLADVVDVFARPAVKRDSDEAAS
ncbi:tyrosine-type recombinase/integrase [Tsukamurella tyrosinosolvens]|uniref:tyrosine-type recombinase/integrase n=1 Tax=Tsukamurella tyrosinosolvens TaxID=57704 RepID=UPI000C7F314D|nr:hypothetical protein ASU32_23220 [Tsukamurella tyrosinosolvens]